MQTCRQGPISTSLASSGLPTGLPLPFPAGLSPPTGPAITQRPIGEQVRTLAPSLKFMCVEEESGREARGPEQYVFPAFPTSPPRGLHSLHSIAEAVALLDL